VSEGAVCTSEAIGGVSSCSSICLSMAVGGGDCVSHSLGVSSGNNGDSGPQQVSEAESACLCMVSSLNSKVN
jgi:hypothetical protein